VAEEPGAVLANALRAGAQQLMRNESLTDLPVLPQDHGTLRTLARRYPGQYAAFERSLQQRGELEARGFRAYAWLLEISFAILTLTACMLAWRWRASHPAFLVLVAGCIGCYAANAFVCGALSMVSDRFGGRVSWPLVFAGLAALARSRDRRELPAPPRRRKIRMIRRRDTIPKARAGGTHSRRRRIPRHELAE
jgi:hypothetical protein